MALLALSGAALKVPKGPKVERPLVVTKKLAKKSSSGIGSIISLLLCTSPNSVLNQFELSVSSPPGVGVGVTVTVVVTEGEDVTEGVKFVGVTVGEAVTVVVIREVGVGVAVGVLVTSRDLTDPIQEALCPSAVVTLAVIVQV